jgi:hypothetical protein
MSAKGNGGEGFTVENPSLPPRLESSPARLAKARPTRNFREHFVRVPIPWAKLPHTYLPTGRARDCILYQWWKREGSPFRFTNILAADWNLSRWQKYRALAELERLGFITVERGRRGTNPLIKKVNLP